MASSGMYGAALLGQYSATAARRVDWITDVTAGSIKVSLHTAAYVPDVDVHAFYSSVTNEITGTGYTAGGKALTGPTLTTDTATNAVVLDAADTTWTGATFTTRIAVIRKDTGTAATSPLLGYLDFGTDLAPAAVPFVIPWDAGGVLRLAF
jgi:hypothetical protein